MIKSVTIVRPYFPRIREKMAVLIEQAEMSIAAVIPAEKSNEQVIAELHGCEQHVLLIPYNAHVDEHGHSTSGMDLLLRTMKERPELRRCPILMPVSETGKVGLRMELKKYRENGALSKNQEDCILIIAEKDLDRSGMANRIREHVERVGHS